MSQSVGSIHYDLGLNTSKFDSAQRAVAGKLNSMGNAITHVAKRIAQAGVAMGVAGAVLGVKTSAQLETARQGFITLLGSAEEADKTMERIKREAARTPFEVAGLTAATQMLASVTKNGDKAIDIILDVGEGLAAMGRGQAELDRISVNLQQIAATGRAAMIDIKQFAFAGIPIFEMLKEETGKSGKALEDFISKGGVTFNMLAKMFDRANDKGGRFFNAFKNQTGTFNQQWSNLKDTFAITASEIVNDIGLFGGLKKAMADVGKWIKDNKEFIIETFKEVGRAIANATKFVIEHKRAIYILAAAFTTLKIAMAIQPFIALFKVLAVATFATKGLTTGLGAMSMAAGPTGAGGALMGLAGFLTNPWVLALVAAAGVTAGLVWWLKRKKEAIDQNVLAGRQQIATEGGIATITELSMNTQKRAKNAVKQATNELTTAKENLRAKDKDLARATNDTRVSQEQLWSKMKDQFIAVQNVSNAKDKLRRKNNELSVATSNLKGWQDKLKRGLDNVVNRIADFGPTASRQLKPIAVLSGQVGALINKAKGINDIQGQATSLRNTLQGSITDIGRLQNAGGSLQGSTYNPQKRQLGGPISKNEMYMVGEKGPELFMSDKIGRILSNKETNKIATAPNITTAIYGNINIASQVDADSFMRRLTRNQELARLGVTVR